MNTEVGYPNLREVVAGTNFAHLHVSPKHKGSRVTYRNKNSLDPKYILKKTCPKKNGNTNLLRNKQTTFNKQKRQKFHRHHGPNGPGPRRIVYARKAWLTNEIHGKDGGLRGGEMGGVGWVGWLGWLVGLVGWVGLVGVGWVGWLSGQKMKKDHELHSQLDLHPSNF